MKIQLFNLIVGQKCLGTSCPQRRGNGRPCRGKLCDFVLDWEAELPDNDLDLSNAHSTLSDLSIVIGSTLQVCSYILLQYIVEYILEKITFG